MLRRLFLAPGYFLYRRFSKKRKKFRFVSKSHETGPAARLALLFWLCACLAAVLAYAALSGEEGSPLPGSALPAEALAPFPSALPGEAAQTAEPEPDPAPARLPSMAESAQYVTPEASAPSEPSTATPPAPAPSAEAVGAVAVPQPAPPDNPPGRLASAAGGAVAVARQGDTARLDGAVPASPAPISVPRELIPPAGAQASDVKPPEAWLVIVESIPKSQRDKAEEALARQRRRGVELSIMDTDAYPRLKSGLWALALGPYDSKREAEAAAAAIKSKVKDFMVRRGL
jgi:hypothetical protein